MVINSFSKFFCMTGWRVGWMVVPERLIRPIERLQQNFSISVPYLSQIAALAAFEGKDEMEAVRAQYARNRDILVEGLPKIGLGRFLPIDGAFYVYIDVSALTNDSMDFCRRAIREAGVAITPGSISIRRRGSGSSGCPSRVRSRTCGMRCGSWVRGWRQDDTATSGRLGSEMLTP